MLGEKAFLRRNVFTMEGPGKGNGVACVTEGDREQEEVTKWKKIDMEDDYHNTESAVAAICLLVAPPAWDLREALKNLHRESY
jgi:hypothetical protein